MRILTDKNGPVTTITINRPEVKNAVDRPTADELVQAFRAFEQDKDSRVAVLTGAGGCFCAGADLKAVSEAGDRVHRLEEGGDGPLGPTRMLLSKPVIAAVAGYAVAGGLEMALWCDLRVVERGAVFGVFCRRWGVPLMDGGTYRLPRLIGLSNALDMILTGRPVEAEEALRMGLANRLVERGESLAEAEALARKIAGFPQQCMRGDRLAAYQQAGMSLQEAIGNEFRIGLSVIESGETVEGAARFSGGAGRHGAFDV